MRPLAPRIRRRRSLFKAKRFNVKENKNELAELVTEQFIVDVYALVFFLDQGAPTAALGIRVNKGKLRQSQNNPCRTGSAD